MTTKDYLVIDLEATCDDRGAVPRQQMEIIEIGAVLVDGETLTPKAEFQTFVRPVRHPTLTEFCRELTSITQEQVDAAPGFPEAIGALREFAYDGRPRRPLFCSWGNYDKHQFEQDARFHGVALPFGPAHLNIKAKFSETLGSKKRFGMARALMRLGLPLVGTHHRGIDDARNIAILLPYAVGVMPFPTPPRGWRRKRRPGATS